MASLQSQLNKIEKKFQKQIFKAREALAKGISKDLRKMLERRVPVDTKTLQQEGLSVEYRQERDSIIIDAYVNGLSLEYSGRQSIRADVLGLILDIGVRGGRELLRTRSQPKNKARTPTMGWFSEDFRSDVKEYLRNGQYKKWLKNST